MAPAEKIQIDICGQTFRIAPPNGDADRLKRAAKLVEDRVNEIRHAGMIDSTRSAVLASLGLALDLLEVKAAHGILNEGDLGAASQKIDEVIKRLDSALTSPDTKDTATQE